jgi:tetratricopeptide (TPR) repeat protein
MKKLKMIFILGIATLLFSNSAWINLTLVKPSQLVVPQNIQSIALLDRTKQENTQKNKVEQVMTGEVFGQDEQAVFQLQEGFIEACSGTKRFVTVRTAERMISTGTKSNFPEPLDWNTISDICEKNQTDALLSIEIFDTDFIIANNPVKLETQNIGGRTVARLAFRASGVAVINLGIRLYDAANRVIIDEYRTTHRMNFDAEAATVQGAINALLDKVEATKRAGYEAGFVYGERITPTYYRVTRYFFDSPRKVLGEGVRYSEVGDWKSAIESWTKVVNTAKRKHAGRAAFNIAVGYEVLGDMDKAKEWASRSYTKFREKDANDYYNTLCARIREEQIVQEQK